MLETGQLIGGSYKILREIGRGGMSVVYLAVNEKANKLWAVKELVRKEFQELEADRKEIALMKRLQNPHLPSIVDVIERGKTLLIVMDYVEGQTLETLIREQGAQPVEQVLDWGRQLCQVLAYLHSRTPPVIYRDMKPSNVMLRPDGTIVLIDLGAAREYKPENQMDTIALGTCGYAAPEQYEEGEQSDARTDIYCLGVMLFQILTGEGPHKLQPVRNLRPEVPGGLEAIVNRCVQAEKEERYQSAEALTYALDHYREQDEAYRAVQKKKVRRFTAVVAVAMSLSLGTFLAAGLERYQRRNSYEACMLAAQNAAGKEQEWEAYEKAILLEPGRAEGWLALLEEGFLDDGFLSAEESERLRALSIRYGRSGRTCEQLFRVNKKGYAEFAYRLGIAYFYKYEESSGKKKAKPYLEEAAVSGKLSEQQTGRAKRLYAIADYYARIGRADEAGDQLISYGAYWQDLQELTAGNLVEEDNARTALVMYEELAGQILSRGKEFQRAGVPKSDIKACIRAIQNRLETDFEGLTEAEKEVIRTEKQELASLLDQAERMLDSVYDGKGEVWKKQN